jgi:hypothetical protein
MQEKYSKHLTEIYVFRTYKEEKNHLNAPAIFTHRHYHWYCNIVMVECKHSEPRSWMAFSHQELNNGLLTNCVRGY